MNGFDYACWQLCVDEYCEGCKGQRDIKFYDGECWKNCEGFQEDYNRTLAEWRAEIVDEHEIRTCKEK